MKNKVLFTFIELAILAVIQGGAAAGTPFTDSGRSNDAGNPVNASSAAPAITHPPTRFNPARAEAEYRKRAFPLGYIPAGARERALKQIEQWQAGSSTGTSSGAGSTVTRGPGTLTWYNIGPEPITKSVYSPSGRCSGRVTALAVDPLDPTHHWLMGAAQGGIWETTDSGVTFQPRTDSQASLAMGAISYAPSSPATVYAGTGEPNFRGDDYAGAGLLMSLDHGSTWAMRNSSFAETSFSSIRVDPANAGNLAVATVRGGGGITDAASGTNMIPGAPARGVFVSSDGGISFNRVLTGEATMLDMDPSNFNRQYAGLGNIYGAAENGVYRTTNGWITSQLINGPWTLLATPTEMGRVALAVSPANPATLYVGIAEARNGYLAGLLGIWRTDNAWAASPTWTQLPSPSVFSDGDTSPRFWYHFYLLAGADNVNFLYLTERNVWRCNSTPGTNPPSWTMVDGTIHVDNHVLAWVIGGTTKKLLLGNDGGLWLSGNDVPAGSFQDLNSTLAISQIYRGAVDPRPAHAGALAGTQDNGTVQATGPPAWPFLYGGDGGACAISSTHPNKDWAYSYSVFTVPYPTSDILRTLNAGASAQYVSSDLDGDLLPDYEQFFVHFEKSPQIDNLFIAGTSRLWRCNNFFSAATPTWTQNSPQMLDASGNPVPLSAMAFAPSDSTAIYAFGTEDGQLRLTANGGTTWANPNSSGAVPRRYVSGLAFSPANSNVLYVTLSGFDEGTPGHAGHVFRTTNALAATPTWVNVTPMGLDLPFDCIGVAPNDASSVFAGCDLGVWGSADGGNTWAQNGPAQGLPNVAVFDLRFNSAGEPTAFTHGRSAYAGRQVVLPFPVLSGIFECYSCVPAPCLQCPPGDEWLNPGDLVEVSIPLQNIAPIDTVELVATLQPSAQVTPITGSQNYGVLVGQGAAVSRVFQFQTSLGGAGSTSRTPGGCGSPLDVVLQLQDGNNSLGQVTVPFYLGVPSHPLNESFEEIQPPGLPAAWTNPVTGAGVPWTSTANPPPNTIPGGDEDAAPPDLPPNTSVFVPDFTGVGQSFLVSPPFTLITTQAQVYFQQAFSVSNSYDGCILEIAIGAGGFIELTQAGGSFGQCGYNGILNSVNPLGTRAAWTGQSGGWLPVYANLPPSALGQTVRLRWDFAASRGNPNGYWFVDTIFVTEPLCLPPVSHPVIVNPIVRGTEFSFGIDTVSGRTYIIEYKTSLNDTNWQYIESLAGNGQRQLVSVPATSGAAFFRYRVQ